MPEINEAMSGLGYHDSRTGPATGPARAGQRPRRFHGPKPPAAAAAARAGPVAAAAGTSLGVTESRATVTSQFSINLSSVSDSLHGPSRSGVPARAWLPVSHSVK